MTLPQPKQKTLVHKLLELAPWLLLVGLLAALLPLPQGARLCFGPGLEQPTLALVQPFRDDGPVGPGVVLAQVEIESAEIRYHLRDVVGAEALVALAPPQEPGQRLLVQRKPAPNPPLQTAQAALADAIARNDDGSLSARLVAPDALTPAQRVGTRATLAAWLLLGLAVLSRLRRMLMEIEGLRRRLLAMALLLALGLLAGGVRLAAPLTPLRPNTHAFTDFAIAMGQPDVMPAYRATRQFYGNTWIDVQRAFVPLAGRTHDGVGLVSAAAGALAVVLAAAAVGAASLQLWPALLAGLVLACAPVAMRIGHSESPVVFAQLLVAASLFLATRRASLLERCGFLAAIALLALAPVIGGALAASVVLLAWAAVHHPLAPRETPPRLTWLRTAPWLLLLALIAATALWQASRLTAGWGEKSQTAQTVRAALANWHPLWPQAAWGAPLALALAAVGVLGWLHATPGWLPRLRLGLVLAGASLAALAPMPSVATSLGSQLRYEATLGPLLVLGFAGAPLLVPVQGGWRKPLFALMLLLALSTAVSLCLPQAGARFLDLQGRSYQQLRSKLGGLRGEVTLLVPTPGRGAMPMAAPIGAWSRRGPVMVEVTSDDFLARCRQGQPPLPQTFVLLDAVCTVNHGAPPCQPIAPLADSGRVLARRAERIPDGGRGEFHTYASDTFTWQLAAARCPPNP